MAGRPTSSNDPPRPDPTPPDGLSRRDFLQRAGMAGAGLALAPGASGSTFARRARGVRPAVASTFEVAFEDGGLSSLRFAGDTFDTEYVTPGDRLGDVLLRYRTDGGAWQALETTAEGVRRVSTASPDGSRQSARVTGGPGDDGPEIGVEFTVEDDAVRWAVTVRNSTAGRLEVGDLAIPLPINRNRGGRDQDPPPPPVLKHGLVAGDGSYFVWSRGNSVGPYLMLTPDEGTHLEYWEAQGGYRVFVHSTAAGTAAAERGGRWRQPHTSLGLDPGEERSYGFTLRWASDYDDAREILVEQGLVDVHVVPGMTLPSDLTAKVALRSRAPIRGVDAEFPDQTRLRRISREGDVTIYEVAFQKLGENRLTVRFGDDRRMHLEFFSTEPLETLMAKRAAFIAGHQHRDPSLWYDGLLAEWAMDTHTLLGPDNYDRIIGWRIYEVTCDDPGLSKPAFLASKNAEMPVQSEVDALDYYIENFVWGGLQKTTEETFSYAIYGIPDWKVNRESEDAGRNGRQHIWRIYDYPHITLMYYSLYRVARNHPQIRTAMAPTDYLRRAYGTALAMFTVPWEVERWSAYQTGLMNELVIEDVIEALESEGMQDEAERLRPHWERKVRTFVNDRPDLFRSEYAFDTTGFEATHALAKYALRIARPADPQASRQQRAATITPEDAGRFMEAQMAANLFCRGLLENAYYLLGSDIRGSGGNGYTLTYMSQMGGWSVLDYGLHHAEEPWPHLRIGYASALSAWALMNTGTAESDYGYWYPGPENDGGAGGGFEPAPFGETWLDQPHHRGSWYYSCEIDLGFCGGLRCARTVVADDPLFGRICLGGELRRDRGELAVVPRDGIRRRFHAMLVGGRLHLETAVDRFAREEPVMLREDLSAVGFRLESPNSQAHTNTVRVSGLPAGAYRVEVDGEAVTTFRAAEGETTEFEVPLAARSGSVAVRVARQA